jgi:hypothetical protein
MIAKKSLNSRKEVFELPLLLIFPGERIKVEVSVLDRREPIRLDPLSGHRPYEVGCGTRAAEGVADPTDLRL